MDDKLNAWFNNLPLAAPTTHSCDKCYENVRSDNWDAKRYHFDGACLHDGAKKFHPCDDGCGKLHTYPPASLSLLVLDMGDCCVVRVERGAMPHTSTDPLKDLGFYGKISIVHKPFADLRAALDDAPVPRIDEKDGPHNEYAIVSEHGTNRITQTAYDALSQLAGHPLPIFEGGKWEELTGAGDGIPCPIWRYSR